MESGIVVVVVCNSIEELSLAIINLSDNMVDLRLNAGNVKNPNVHKVGIIALGSHLENHGPALPIDTDAKIASYIAFKAALESGAKYLGVIYPAHEIKEINHGIHVSLDDLTNEIIKVLKSAKKLIPTTQYKNYYMPVL